MYNLDSSQKISLLLTFSEILAYMLLMVTPYSDMFVIIFTQLGFVIWGLWNQAKGNSTLRVRIPQGADKPQE